MSNVAENFELKPSLFISLFIIAITSVSMSLILSAEKIFLMLSVAWQSLRAASAKTYLISDSALFHGTEVFEWVLDVNRVRWPADVVQEGSETFSKRDQYLLVVVKQIYELNPYGYLKCRGAVLSSLAPSPVPLQWNSDS